MDLLSLLFPKTCLGCGKEGNYICQSCLTKVRRPKAVCPECLKPAIDGMTHSKCLRPHGLDGLNSLWNYEGVIRKAILALKYKFADEVAKELSSHAVGDIILNSPFLIQNSYIVVPVPLYWLRKNWRGFNQSEEIGRLIAGGLSLKFEPNLLLRRQLKSPQTELKRKERFANIHGVFAVSPSILISQYPNIFLFDDVWTTGSTLKEAAKVLKRAGVKKVWGLTLARAIS